MNPKYAATLLLMLSPAPAQQLSEADTGRVMDRLIRNSGQVLEVPSIQQAIQRLGDRVVENSGYPERRSFTFVVLNDPVPNGFSVPGGYVYVTTGLLNLAGSRDEAAAILAHEVAHVQARRQTKIRFSLQKSFLTLPYCAQVDTPVGCLALVILGGFHEETLHPEFQADELAVAYCRQAAFDGTRLADVLSRVAAFSAPGVPALPGWHRQWPANRYPNLEERIRRIRQVPAAKKSSNR